MKVVIIGATGQLGQDLLNVFGDQAIGLTHRDVEVSDGVGVARLMQDIRPDWVINTAAYHNVDDCERHPTTAMNVNAIGASNVARAASAVDAGVVFFSTDYVFGADKRQRNMPFAEEDCPRPLNAYGVSKVAGEQLVMLNNPRHIVVRSAGLYGTSTSRKGWTFPELMITKARAGEHLKVVDDQVLSPTYTADLACTVQHLMSEGATGLFHITNCGECSWYEFACETLRLAGLPASIEPVMTTIPNGSAHRPPYSAMTSERLCATGSEPIRPWQDALGAYMHAKSLV